MSRVIFLHGASSSGKSTLAQAIRDQSPLPWVQLSFDHFRDGGSIQPQSYEDWHSARPVVFDALHQTFAAFADAGCDLIIEHILDTSGWHRSLQTLLAGHDVLFVGVVTAHKILEDRERERGDRALGSAVADAQTIHEGMSYDITIDGSDDPRENADRILIALDLQTQVLSGFFETP